MSDLPSDMGIIELEEQDLDPDIEFDIRDAEVSVNYTLALSIYLIIPTGSRGLRQE